MISNSNILALLNSGTYNNFWFVLEIDHCLNNNCKNGAQCRDDVGKYVCECQSGYQGVLCDQGEYINILINNEHFRKEPNAKRPSKGTNFNEKEGRNMTFLGRKILDPSLFSLKLVPSKGIFALGSSLKCLLLIVVC